MKITDVKEKEKRPIRMIQFGEGRFLRAFIEEYVEDGYNAEKFDGSICVVKPRAGGSVDTFNAQDCMYTLIVRGIKNGEIFEEKRIMTSIDSIIQCKNNEDVFLNLAHINTIDIVVSNTTEAGICVNNNDSFNDISAQTYPGKLTRLLYERYKFYDGDRNKGFVIIPLELNENNGELLKNAVYEYIKLWNLSNLFKEWIDFSCVFCSTLVDRIVSGYSVEELPYEDELIDVCEPYKLFAIQTDNPDKVKEKLPMLEDSSVIITEDISIYRERKVKVLNGVHTATALLAYNAGFAYVEQMVNDDSFGQYINKIIYEEILLTIDMEKDELKKYAEEVMQRFKNPFLNHKLKDISMNSISKFKVRVIPTIQEYKEKKGEYPIGLVFSLAGLLNFYKEGICENVYDINDSREVQNEFSNWDGNDIEYILSSKELWGEYVNLTKELINNTQKNMDLISKFGIKGAIRNICE